MPVQIFGEWKPDQPAHLQDGVLQADGVIPIANGYAPVPAFATVTNGTLADTCLGAAAYRTLGSVYIFAADATDLYLYSSSGFTSLKNGLTTTAAAGMRFCPYNTLMLATNGVDPIQKFDPSSPSSTTNLDASAPTARFLAVVRGFVVAGYTDDNPLQMAWSNSGAPASWTPGSGSEAGSFIMPTGGDITGVVGGEYGLVFQENRIVRMTYTGDDAIWQFDEIATDIGCIAPWSLATYGRLTFFLSNKGFMACDGVTVQPIGAEKVDRTFLALYDQTYVDSMSAAVDPRSSIYYVSVPSARPTERLFAYHFGLQRWTTAAIASERIFSSLSQSIDLEGIDAIYGNLDAVTVSLDSVLFRGGYPLLMLFDSSHRLGTLSGSNIAAKITDAYREYFPGKRARVRSVRPFSDAPALTVNIGGVNDLSNTPTQTGYTTRSGGGFYRMREQWNQVQVELSIAAGAQWSYMQGYDIEAVQGSRA